MADAYLALQRTHRGVQEILLAQKNIYIPPTGRYQYASIARNAIQYVIPGGFVQPGELPAEAAAREFFEDTGLQIPLSALRPIVVEPGKYTFFKSTSGAEDIDVDGINAALAAAKHGSQKFHNMLWCPLDEALGRLGNKAEYHAFPWVANQIHRALNAGFTREIIGLRVNEPHDHFMRAIAQLILEAYGGAASTETALVAAEAS